MKESTLRRVMYLRLPGALIRDLEKSPSIDKGLGYCAAECLSAGFHAFETDKYKINPDRLLTTMKVQVLHYYRATANGDYQTISVNIPAMLYTLIRNEGLKLKLNTPEFARRCLAYGIFCEIELAKLEHSE